MRTYTIAQMGETSFVNETLTTNDLAELQTRMRNLANLIQRRTKAKQVLVYAHCPEMGPMTGEDHGFVVGSDNNIVKPGTYPTDAECPVCGGAVVRIVRTGQSTIIACDGECRSEIIGLIADPRSPVVLKDAS